MVERNFGDLSEQANEIWKEIKKVENKILSLVISSDMAVQQVQDWIREYEKHIQSLEKIHKLVVNTSTYKVKGPQYEVIGDWEELNQRHIAAKERYFQKKLQIWRNALKISHQEKTRCLNIFVLTAGFSKKELAFYDNALYAIRSIVDAHKKGDLSALVELRDEFNHRNTIEALLSVRSWASKIVHGNKNNAHLKKATANLVDRYLYTFAPIASNFSDSDAKGPTYPELAEGEIRDILKPFPLTDLAGINELKYSNELRVTRGFHSSATYDPGKTGKLPRILIHRPVNNKRPSREHIQRTLGHEIGHHVYAVQLDDHNRAEWEATTLLNQTSVSSHVISRYPEESQAEEEFAEVYRIYRLGDPKSNKDTLWLALEHPERYNFLVDHLLEP